MHFFTSISSNYLPKARVLARSVKEHAPGCSFHLLLCDAPPGDFFIESEDFDHLILLEELLDHEAGIDNRRAWIYQHNVVELCTAVKGMAFREIFRRFGAEKVVFLDPDIVVFSDLGIVERYLDEHSILLTPHQTCPEQRQSAILDAEVASLKFGVFNLGFIALRNSAEGRRFVDWWAARLRDFCFDERGKGLFTDQKWADLAPAFFPDLGILREPQLNVSTWNINQRQLTGNVEEGICVDGAPLCFYHFSGVDSGALKVMMDIYGAANPVLGELRQWYASRCDEMGQRELGDQRCVYDDYSNGEPVRPAERLLYRYREELQDMFPDPYDCTREGGYLAWYRRHAGTVRDETPEEETVRVMRQELDAIRHSITWRLFRKMSSVYRRLGINLGLRRFLSS